MPDSRRGTGFTNFEDFLGLNKAGATGLGNSLYTTQNEQASGVQANAMDALTNGGYLPGQYSGQLGAVQQRQGMLDNQDGRAALLQDRPMYGDSTWGGREYDSALVGAGGNNAYADQTRAHTAQLQRFLGMADAHASTPTAPPLPEPTTPTAPVSSKPRPSGYTSPNIEDHADRNRYGRNYGGY